jgi:hypothetical protein
MASATQVVKLERELKSAFAEGRSEGILKKAEELLRADPSSRLATRILEKVEEKRVEELKRANAGRIKDLEAGMERAFRDGDLPELDRLMAEVKTFDPKNRKVKGYEETIAKARISLEEELRKEKVQQLVSEIEFFVNRAEWGSVESKSNGLLAVQWNHPVALHAIERVAKARKVMPASLITVKAPIVQKKPGFLASLFAKPSSAKAAEAVAAKAPVVLPAAKPVAVEVAKPVAVLAPVQKPAVMEAKKPEPVKAVPAKAEPKPAKPGFLASLFAKKPEVAKPLSAKVEIPVAKSSIVFKSVPQAVQDVKKGEPIKTLPKFNVLAGMLDSKPLVSNPIKEALAPVAAVKPMVELKSVTPVAAAKPVVELRPAAKPVVPEAGKAEPKPSEPGLFARFFATKPEPVLVGVLASAVKPAVESKPVAVAKSVSPAIEAKPAMAVGIAMPVVSAVEAKPVVAEMAKPSIPEVKKMEPAKPVEILSKATAQAVMAPMVVPVAAVPEAPKLEPKPVAKTPEVQLKAEQKTVAKPEANGADKGNIFTSLFGKGEEIEPGRKSSASVLETIVAKSAPVKSAPKAEKVPEVKTGEGLLSFASGFLKFATLFILVSGAFLYMENMDTGNTVLKLVNKENNAIQLHGVALKVEKAKADMEKVNKEINKYKGGYTDDHQKAIDRIVANRMDWPAILAKLNEVTESVYAKNAISQYVQYNNYSYNTDTGKFTVSGTLSDPLGKNLTKLAELEEAFRNYPKDPSNPNDERKPYFFGMTKLNSFSKSLDSDTGRFKSSFNVSVTTKDASTAPKKK